MTSSFYGYFYVYVIVFQLSAQIVLHNRGELRIKHLILGCVADDFTGASDMASFLVKGGLNTLLIDGLPEPDWLPDTNTQAIVIALKSRTDAVDKAVADSLACFRWLNNTLHARQLYFKYCSTFDSTPNGNIGPVIDAVLEEFDFDQTIISPALPVNGRCVFEGHLFVNGDLLENSSMRNHPLTPMTESSLPKLIEAQGSGKAAKISFQILDKNVNDIAQHLTLQENARYLIPDYFNKGHAETIARIFSNYRFLTGSSGLAEPLARLHSRQDTTDTPMPAMTSEQAPSLVLAGSCSVATREQISEFSRHFDTLHIAPLAITDAKKAAENLWQWVSGRNGKPCLVYSSDNPESVKKVQQSAGSQIAGLLEETFGLLAHQAVINGVRRLIVAGGETSGSVMQSLGYRQYKVGVSIAPGVPVIQPTEAPDLLLTLKSGNFGGPDFFLKAIELMNSGNV